MFWLGILGFALFLVWFFQPSGDKNTQTPNIKKASKISKTKTINEQPEESVVKNKNVNSVHRKESLLAPKPNKLEKKPSIDNGKFNGRFVIGGDFKNVDVIPENISFENEINPSWKELAVKEYLDEDEDGMKVDVDHLEGLVFLREGVGLYVEKAKIKIWEGNVVAGEFMAYLDSKTGEVLHAWDPNATPEISGNIFPEDNAPAGPDDSFNSDEVASPFPEDGFEVPPPVDDSEPYYED